MKVLRLSLFSLALLSNGLFAQTLPVAPACNSQGPQADGSQVLSCYRQQLAQQPLDYWFVDNKQAPREYRYLLNSVLPAHYHIDPSKPPVQVNTYKLNSQSWSPAGLVTPQKWTHDVSIYIPKDVKGTTAVLAIDMTPDVMIDIAQSTNTIVVSLDNIPSVGLIYDNDKTPRIEDDSIGRSFELFMDNPDQRQTLPLHVPMSAAISQTIRLAQLELKPWHVDKFIVTGASKRGWASWLAGISDPSVVAIVPFVADILNTKDIIKHMYKTYGGNWPIAFKPYYDHKVDLDVDKPAFDKLMKIEDPLQYRDSSEASRLAIPKYIVNASGDDFFPADDSHYYYDQLPGEKSMRVAPNSDHMGIEKFMQSSLVPFVNRYQDHVALPTVTVAKSDANNPQQRLVTFSEKPVKVVQWTAVNTDSRDFRYNCGIRYTSEPLTATEANTVNLSLDYSGAGWQARFIEATFADGYVATTQVYITPDAKYPVTAPASKGGSCQTLPGRAQIN
ncbi:PhoPQ-activated protein PqaA family protein [Serratia sp. M24T3]|uniref:PhoPQ-activated protein PqaA family protein n=1 Tax=Serratia sp. M24T3 TaxID=932213 RepID=UPI00025B90B7|nr:PhoPQ-activated protein PqaA family protein [Serratia sp. M24T3]EIC84976.1 hypothetical protein SPM24T3_09534 [Serratia sp. M24T3]